MSVPEKPYTRKEAYLNAAATGDTSGIPETPYTREEMYLDAIARKGGGGGGGGSSTLSDLTDVDISNPTDGQTLVYNATSGKWENGENAGGGVLVIYETVEGTTHTLDKTWQQIRDAYLPVVIFDVPDGDGTMRTWNTFITASDDNYSVSVDGISYYAGSASGYPSTTE